MLWRRARRRTRSASSVPGERNSGSRSSGRASTAAMITSAWSTNSSPSTNASRTGSCSSLASAAANFGGAVGARAGLPGLDARASRGAVGAGSASTSIACPWAVTRARSSASWASRKVTSTIASRVSARPIDQTGTSRTSLSTSSIRVIADLIGWLVIGLFKPRPPTFKAVRNLLWRGPDGRSVVEDSRTVERETEHTACRGRRPTPRPPRPHRCLSVATTANPSEAGTDPACVVVSRLAALAPQQPSVSGASGRTRPATQWTQMRASPPRPLAGG